MTRKKSIFLSIGIVLLVALTTIGVLAFKMMEPAMTPNEEPGTETTQEESNSEPNQQAVDAFITAQEAIIDGDESSALENARQALQLFEQNNNESLANEVRQFIQAIENPDQPITPVQPEGIEAGE